MSNDTTVVVGRISKAHGIRGELTVQVRTDEPERRFAPGSSLVAGSRTLTVESVRKHQGRLLLRFTEVPDRDAAEALHGTVLEARVDAHETPEGPEEYYDRQLVGLAVLAADGQQVGSVTAVIHLPEQDTLAVDSGGREILVPFVSALVPTVDLAAGTVTLADVPGLIDLDAAETAD
ncbi:hypothetical protein ASD11_08505 [Aeromicrobium sp. Root495]|uniref:ribosome maturation factor RimM n=1 Tax=Aeromicrobium sp. Root495 TaxID=1736550 RepID=UPI0006F22ABB|nr:ribosome maturation factor RimM [Aeromicrobium sp. Root495]KQY59585.1 hypothetical protein ASD11_08505 [Aeromicrobium sp. Root495]RYJ05125.1 MAG: ribosome maturation factor RimM [Actinomycetales bacterium]